MAAKHRRQVLLAAADECRARGLALRATELEQLAGRDKEPTDAICHYIIERNRRERFLTTSQYRALIEALRTPS
jgi:hypothetical protein